MSFTLSQSSSVVCAVAALWLMMRAGSAKKMLELKVNARCAACGRRLRSRPCPCSHGD